MSRSNRFWYPCAMKFDIHNKSDGFETRTWKDHRFCAQYNVLIGGAYLCMHDKLHCIDLKQIPTSLTTNI